MGAMKKIFRTLVFVAAFSVAVVSCRKEEITIDTIDTIDTKDNTPAQKQYYRYAFDVAETETRAILEYDGVFWEENDAVGMYLAGSHKEANINIETTPKTIFLNSTNAIQSGSTAYAYFPYDSRNSDITSTIIGIPHEQAGGAVSAMPMVGVPFTIQPGDTNGEVFFLNMGAIIDFKVFSSTHSDETVKYIIFRDDSGTVAGDALMDLSALDPDDETTLVFSGWGSNQYNAVTVRNQTPVAADKAGASSIYMVVAPGEYVSGTITVGTDKAVYTFNYTNKPLERNELKHYNMNLDSANARRESIKTLPYSETFESNPVDFTTDGVTISSNTAVWQYNATDKAMKATAYKSGANATVSWLTSPWVDLTGVNSAVVSFDQYYRYETAPQDRLTLWVLTDEEGADGVQLPLTTYTLSDWVNSGEIALDDYVGHFVRIGFKYESTSTNTQCATWEIKNFLIKEKVTIVNGNFTWNLAQNETYSASASEISWRHSDPNVSMSVVKGSSQINANNYYGGDSDGRTSTRFYNGQTLTITPGAGVTINSIVFTATGTNYANALMNSTWTGANATVSDKVVTVTPTNGQTVFSAAIRETCGFTSVQVNYSYETTSGGGGSSGGGQTVSGLQYLGCIEVPALSLANTSACTDSGEETFGNTMWYAYNTTVSTRRVATHTYSYGGKTYRNFTVMVDQNKRCPLWSAYPMHKGAYPSNSLGRVGSFSESHSYDPAFENSWQSSGSTSDYNNGAGYARGHLCASADRQAVEEANEQTFYYTNQAPQIQNSFNSGVWSSLEGAVQANAPLATKDTLYVVSGVLFEDGNTGSSNDGGTVGRPSHFYKLLMLCTYSGGTITAASGVAYIYTNAAHTGVNYNDSQFRTSIHAIETRTGFDFFPNVPDNLETAAENMTASLW